MIIVIIQVNVYEEPSVNHCLSVYIFFSELVCHKIVKCNEMWIKFI